MGKPICKRGLNGKRFLVFDDSFDCCDYYDKRGLQNLGFFIVNFDGYENAIGRVG